MLPAVAPPVQALHPHVLNQHANVNADFAAQRVHHANAVRNVGHARRRTRAFEQLDHLVTSPELGNAVIDEVMCVAAAVVPQNQAGAPLWAAAILQGQQQMQQQLQQQMQQMQQQMQQGFLQVHVALQTNAACLANRDATRGPDPLQPLPDQNGQVPPNFPATRAALEATNGPAAAALCLAYNLPVPRTLDQKREALRHHLGMPF